MDKTGLDEIYTNCPKYNDIGYCAVYVSDANYNKRMEKVVGWRLLTNQQYTPYDNEFASKEENFF